MVVLPMLLQVHTGLKGNLYQLSLAPKLKVSAVLKRPDDQRDFLTKFIRSATLPDLHLPYMKYTARLAEIIFALYTFIGPMLCGYVVFTTKAYSTEGQITGVPVGCTAPEDSTIE
jgi:hypothetical protein